jgi:hypothetical protein
MEVISLIMFFEVIIFGVAAAINELWHYMQDQISSWQHTMSVFHDTENQNKLYRVWLSYWVLAVATMGASVVVLWILMRAAAGREEVIMTIGACTSEHRITVYQCL